VIEGKTGSGSLVDSSVCDDWSYRSPWGTKRSLPSGRSVSQTKPNETSSFQQRSISNAGLPTTFSSTGRSLPAFASRPQTINLNATSSTHPRPVFTSVFSGNAQSRATEQPPNVYTKFDRPIDPNARKPDSAKEGLWPEYSPADERRPGVFAPLGRTFSQPVSRDGSKPTSSYGAEPLSFHTPDYSRPSYRQTQNNSRAPSVSSQSNGGYNAIYGLNPDQLSMQLNQLNMNSDSRPQTSYRPQGPASGSTFGRPPFSLYRPSLDALQWSTFSNADDMADETDDFDASPLSFPGLGVPPGQQASPFQSFGSTAPTNRLAQAPTAPVFRPGHPYANGALAVTPYEASVGGRPGTNLQLLNNGPRHLAQAPQMQEPPLFFDPRAQQMLSTNMRTPYGGTMSPYVMPNPVPLAATAYSQYLPLATTGIDPMANVEDTSAREGVQSALMYEFRSNPKSRRYELKDIYEHIAEFSGDQHGSRFIQTKLETANSDEKDRVFREIEPNAIPLMTDVFGNYVIQKFFEHGDQTHKKILANKMRGHVLNLSMSMYGCRVVQKALDHVLVDQQAELIGELKNHVVECVKDQNGNHVIQKAIESCEPEAIRFIIASFEGNVQNLSVHPYGCRVIQRCLERCDAPSKRMVMDELIHGIQGMIQDQFGNYVVQHIVEHDQGEARRCVMDIVIRGLENYSKHKFASNVVEKCLANADIHWKRSVVWRFASDSHRRSESDGLLVSMIKDSYGNYVIRKHYSTRCMEGKLTIMQRNCWKHYQEKTTLRSSTCSKAPSR
jgi:mRNA-binding protein PUF3